MRRDRSHSRPPRPRTAGRIERAAACLCVVWLVGCAAPSLPRATTEGSSFRFEREPAALGLGAEDRVRVGVLGHPELSTPPDGQRVDGEGMLALPLIGAVEVAGKTPEAVRADIEQRLRTYVQRPSVTVSVAAHGSHRVFILGHVQAPGEYILDGPRNALQALSLSGGFREGADRARVAILRVVADGEIDVHVFDAATPDADGLVAVQRGDLLFVRQTGAGTFAEQARPVLTTMATVLGTAANVAESMQRLGFY